MTDAHRQCPVCRATNLGAAPDGAWRCHVCDTRFHLVDGQPVVTHAGEAPGATRAIPRRALAVAAVVIVAGGLGVASGLMLRSTDDGSGTSAPEARVRGPAAEIASVREGRTDDGLAYWLVLYRNTGPTPIQDPGAEVGLFGRDGAPIGRPIGRATLSVLPSGAEIPILVQTTRTGFSRSEVDVVRPQAPEREIPEAPLLVRDVTASGPEGAPDTVSGVLRNVHDTPLAVRDVIAVGRDASGAPVAWASGLPEERVLQPKQATTFELEVGRYVVETPAYWTGHASGMVMR